MPFLLKIFINYLLLVFKLKIFIYYYFVLDFEEQHQYPKDGSRERQREVALRLGGGRRGEVVPRTDGLAVDGPAPGGVLVPGEQGPPVGQLPDVGLVAGHHPVAVDGRAAAAAAADEEDGRGLGED